MTTKLSKRIFALIMLLCMILSLTGCYSERRIIGRTSIEVEEMYGPFDRRLGSEPGADGLYRNANVLYFVRKKKSFDETITYYFRIRFDENGVAVECENNYVDWN